MALTPGSSIGSYQITDRLGHGGMGEVYRARDTKLDREVAIKVLPDAFAESAERVARFEREAKTLASLNHPNIGAIHGLEDSAGVKALVLELVEGPTLADRIAQGPMPLAEALPIAKQIADALEAAHESGVVHRDLKPSNIKVRPDGTVKVLDFGLAKAYAESGGEDQTLSPTLTSPAQTQQGVILGTAAYMSPEQAAGRPADQRSDIYSFGAVLYEMVTGARLHAGETTTEVIAGVIKDAPRWDSVPPEVHRLLRRCLEKDPRKRQRHIGDVMALVDEVPAAPSSPPTASHPVPVAPAGRSSVPWGIIAGAVVVVAAVAGVAIWAPWNQSVEDAASIRFEIQPTAEMTFINGGFPMVSPDGQWVVFPAVGTDGVTRMWLRALNSVEARPLAGTESGNALPPPVFWSPDSRFIAFGSTPGPFSAGQLMKLDIRGGPVTPITDVPAAVPSGTWNDDGVIVFAANGAPGLFRVAAAGGVATPVTVRVPGDGDHRSPQFLPDGRRFLYLRVSSDATRQGMYVGSIDVAPEDQASEPLLLGDRQAIYSPGRAGETGRLVFLRDTTLYAQPFDPGRLELSGDPVPVADQVGSFAPATAGLFSVSENGVLTYRVGPGGDQTQLTWVDARGSVLGSVGDRASNNNPAISPDGTRVAVTLFDRQGGDSNIWVLDIERGTSAKVTFGAGRNDFPVWSPDGRSLAFASNRDGGLDLYRKNADGSGQEQLLFASDEDKQPWSWSADGRYLLFASANVESGADLWVLPMAGDPVPVPLLRTPLSEQQPRISPDGRWFAYISNESGNAEVYVRRFAVGEGSELVTSGRWLISRNGGVFPVWASDGRTLFYAGLNLQQMAVEVLDASGEAFEAGVPQPLFSAEVLSRYDVAPDLERFLLRTPESAAGPSPFVVVTNWQAGLR